MTDRTHDVVTLDIGSRPVDVDSCIATLVLALNGGGLRTVASCCGHGNRPGNIALADGRELIIAADYDQARAVDAAFPNIHGDVQDTPRSAHDPSVFARPVWAQAALGQRAPVIGQRTASVDQPAAPHPPSRDPVTFTVDALCRYCGKEPTDPVHEKPGPKDPPRPLDHFPVA